jgi:hypothetical protein
LCTELEENNVRTLKASGDADLLIAQTGIDCAQSCHRRGHIPIGSTVASCNANDAQPYFFRSDKQKKHTGKVRCLNINELRESLGQQIMHYLPFLHAIAGCDTTSRLFGIGKGVPLKKIKDDSGFGK